MARRGRYVIPSKERERDHPKEGNGESGQQEECSTTRDAGADGEDISAGADTGGEREGGGSGDKSDAEEWSQHMTQSHSVLRNSGRRV